MRSVELGVVASVTDRTVGVGDLASAVEQAGLESLFLTEHTHVPVSRPDVLQEEAHSQDPYILEPFTALGAAAVAQPLLGQDRFPDTAGGHDTTGPPGHAVASTTTKLPGLPPTSSYHPSQAGRNTRRVAEPDRAGLPGGGPCSGIAIPEGDLGGSRG